MRIYINRLKGSNKKYKKSLGNPGNQVKWSIACVFSHSSAVCERRKWVKKSREADEIQIKVIKTVIVEAAKESSHGQKGKRMYDRLYDWWVFWPYRHKETLSLHYVLFLLSWYDATRYSEAIPVCTLKTAIQTDQGTYFMTKSSAYHHQYRGAFKHFHQTLESMIKKGCLKTGWDWDEIVFFCWEKVCKNGLSVLQI